MCFVNLLEIIPTTVIRHMDFAFFCFSLATESAASTLRAIATAAKDRCFSRNQITAVNTILNR